MVNQDVSRYGLATHLAIAAALPVALSQFVSASVLGCCTLWVSAFAALWMVMEPSVFAGETVSMARRRMVGAMVRDPFVWFLMFAVLFSMIRWLNSDIRLVFSPETAVWTVKEPTMAIMPASSGDAGFLPFSLIVAAAMVMIGVRHALGRNARLWFGVFAGAVSATGAMAAVICAGLGMEPFKSAAMATFGAPSFPGSMYALLLPVAVACGVEAEERGITKSRLLLAWAVAGNAAGAYVFLPMLLSLPYLALSAVAAAFALALAKCRKSAAIMARGLAMLSLGIVMAATAIITMPGQDVRSSKIGGLEVEKAYPSALVDRNAALRRIAKTMWLTHPWSGVGVGAFPLQASFNADEEDWSVLPPQPKSSGDWYTNLIAERGIVGGLMWAIAVGFLLCFWCVRLVGAFRWRSEQNEGFSPSLNVPAVAWIGPLVLVAAAVDVWFSAGLPVASVPVCIAVAMPLAAASFPKPRRNSDDKDDKRG